MSGRTAILDWRPMRRSPLLGFARVQFPSGMIVAEIGIYQAGTRIWAAPPNRPMIGADGALLRDETGKVRYAAIVSFMNHGTRSSWSRQVVEAIREQHPQAFTAAEDAA